MTTETVFQNVANQAETIKNDAERTIATMSVGDEVRQGDVYLTSIGTVPTGAILVKNPESQLAPGATQGSRHCLRSLAGAKVYGLASPGPLDGPILDVPEGCAVDHPEHGNLVLPGGVYAVTYQRAFAAELRRVQD